MKKLSFVIFIMSFLPLSFHAQTGSKRYNCEELETIYASLQEKRKRLSDEKEQAEKENKALMDLKKLKKSVLTNPILEGKKTSEGEQSAARKRMARNLKLLEKDYHTITQLNRAFNTRILLADGNENSFKAYSFVDILQKKRRENPRLSDKKVFEMAKRYFKQLSLPEEARKILFHFTHNYSDNFVKMYSAAVSQFSDTLSVKFGDKDKETVSRFQRYIDNTNERAKLNIQDPEYHVNMKKVIEDLEGDDWARSFQAQKFAELMKKRLRENLRIEFLLEFKEDEAGTLKNLRESVLHKLDEVINASSEVGYRDVLKNSENKKVVEEYKDLITQDKGLLKKYLHRAFTVPDCNRDNLLDPDYLRREGQQSYPRELLDCVKAMRGQDIDLIVRRNNTFIAEARSFLNPRENEGVMASLASERSLTCAAERACKTDSLAASRPEVIEIVPLGQAGLENEINELQEEADRLLRMREKK